jgi:hypothetical protein
LLLLSACSEAYHAEKIVESIRDQLAAEQKTLENAQSSQSYARGSLSGTYRDLHTARSEKEYEQVARSGAAGMSEQLRAGKKILDNKSYSSVEGPVDSRPNRRVDEATKTLEYADEQVKKNADAVENTKSQLKQAEAVLAKVRATR